VLATSANFFEKENLAFRFVSEGTKHVLNAPGNDRNRDLSMRRVCICGIKLITLVDCEKMMDYFLNPQK